MAEPESFDAWLKDFTDEVDSALKGGEAAKPAATPAGRSAQQAFDRWWQSEQQPVTTASPSLELPAMSAPAPKPAPVIDRLLAEDWPARIERLAEDKAAAQQKADAAEQENRALRERLSTVQSQIADFETRLSKSRQGYEEHIARLESKAAELGEALRASAPLEESLRAAKETTRALEEKLELERHRADASERQLLDARQRLVELERQLAQQKQDAAAQAGVLEELRRQSSVYQHRLVQAKESTDMDVVNMRRELKVFLEDLRLIRNSMRKGEA